MIKNSLLIISFFASYLVCGQKFTNYKFLTNDKYKNKIYEKFESKVGNKVYVWQKIVESFENDPSTESTEYYLQINCENKTSTLKTIVIHWRDGNVEKRDDPSNKEIPITSMESLPGFSYKKYCTK